MKTKSKFSAYILRVSTSAPLFSCVIVAVCWAINLPAQLPKTLPHYKRGDGTLNDNKLLIWSANTTEGGGSAAREGLASPTPTPTPTPTCTASGLLIVAGQTNEFYDYAELDD